MIKIKKDNKKRYILLSVVALLILCGMFAYVSYSDDKKVDQNLSQSQDTVNLEPATEEDKQRSEQNKQAIVERDEKIENSPSSSTGKKIITPIITYAGQYGGQVEVGGYVGGVFEDGGTCTANFSKGSANLTRKMSAVKNVNSVDCPAIEVQTSDFSSKGIWSVILSYQSSSAQGSSETKQIEIK